MANRKKKDEALAALHDRLAAALRLRLHSGKRFVLFLSV